MTLISRFDCVKCTTENYSPKKKSNSIENEGSSLFYNKNYKRPDVVPTSLSGIKAKTNIISLCNLILKNCCCFRRKLVM